MSKWIEIEEVIRPAVQGNSRPYYCRGSDGYYYFVKGRPRNSQGAEWICGHLARAFGLPIPEFEIVNISEQLLSEVPDDRKQLGSGPAFGSRAVKGISWMELEGVDNVPSELQLDILVFDWWIQNLDRTPTNPNLLRQAAEGNIIVIDHNLAFDRDFDPQGFLDDHLFGIKWSMLDLVSKANYSQRLVEALSSLEVACNGLPEEWSWQDTEQTVPSNLDLSHIRKIISRCNLNTFWSEV